MTNSTFPDAAPATSLPFRSLKLLISGRPIKIQNGLVMCWPMIFTSVEPLSARATRAEPAQEKSPSPALTASSAVVERAMVTNFTSRPCFLKMPFAAAKARASR